MTKAVEFKYKWENKRSGSLYFQNIIRGNKDKNLKAIFKDLGCDEKTYLSNPSFWGKYNFKVNGCNITSKENKIYKFYYLDIKRAYLSLLIYLNTKGIISLDMLFKVMDEMFKEWNKGKLYSNIPNDFYNMPKSDKDFYNTMIGRIVICKETLPDAFFNKFNMLWDVESRIYIHTLITYTIYAQMCLFAKQIHEANGFIVTATTDGLVYGLRKDDNEINIESNIFKLDKYPLIEYYKIGDQQCLISKEKGVEYKGNAKYIDKVTLENKGKFNDLVEFVLGKNAWKAFLNKIDKCQSIDFKLFFINNSVKWINNFITEYPNNNLSKTFINENTEVTYYLHNKPTLVKWKNFLNSYSKTEIEYSKVYQTENAMLGRSVGRCDYINKEIIEFDKYLLLDNIKPIIDSNTYDRVHIKAPCRSGKTFQILHYANQTTQTIIAVFTEASLIDMIEECKNRGYIHENRKGYHYFNKRFILCYFNNLHIIQQYFNDWKLIIDEEHNFGFYKENYNTILSWRGTKFFVSATPSYTMLYDKCYEFVKKDKANIDNLKIITSSKIIDINNFTDNKWKYIYIDSKDKIDVLTDRIEGVVVKVYNLSEKHLSFRYNVSVNDEGFCSLKDNKDCNKEGMEIIIKGWYYHINKINNNDYSEMHTIKIQSFKLANKILKDCMENNIPCTIISTCLTTMGTDFKLPEHLKREVTICSYLINDINNAVQAVNRFKDGCKEVILISPSEQGNYSECGKIDRWNNDWNKYNIDQFLFKRKLINRQGLTMALNYINDSFNVLNTQTIPFAPPIKYTNSKITDKNGKVYKIKDLIPLYEQQYKVETIENVTKDLIEKTFFEFMQNYNYSHASRGYLKKSIIDHYIKQGVLNNVFSNQFDEIVFIDQQGHLQIIQDSIDKNTSTKGARVGEAVGKAVGKAVSKETISKQDGLGYFQMSGLKGYKAYLEWCKNNNYEAYSKMQFYRVEKR
jgi:hypothetical protein